MAVEILAVHIPAADGAAALAQVLAEHAALYAATEPGLEGGVYVGPDGIGELRGHPRVVSPTRAARDPEAAARLWGIAEELTGVEFPL